MANRKLLGEIDRVLKKVDEGVAVFEQIWDKVYSATTTAQKEKYEGDLKKEIKKLQRLRDQIKNWQGDSSIKDKTKLDANRKLIEEKMEKFKVCEKETKTKAFSKEGLAQDRTDPKQKAKAEVGDWVREAISRLREQSDEFEAEIETLNSGAKRKKRGEELPRVGELKEHIQRHGYHVEMLEKVLRAVDNDQVTPEQCDDDLREMVDYYLDANQDTDFLEDDSMYDAFNLEFAAVPAVPATGGPPAVPGKKSDGGRSGSKEGDNDQSVVPPGVAPAGSASLPGSIANPTVALDAIGGDAPASAFADSRKSATSPKSTRAPRGPPGAATVSVDPAGGARVGGGKQGSNDARLAAPSSLISPSRRSNSAGRDSSASSISPTRDGRQQSAQNRSQPSLPPTAPAGPLMSSIVKGQTGQSQQLSFPGGSAEGESRLTLAQASPMNALGTSLSEIPSLLGHAVAPNMNDASRDVTAIASGSSDGNYASHLMKGVGSQSGQDGLPSGSSAAHLSMSGDLGVVSGAGNVTDDPSIAGHQGAAVQGVAPRGNEMNMNQSGAVPPTSPANESESQLSALEAARAFMPEAVKVSNATGPGGAGGPGSRNLVQTPPSFPAVAASVFDNRSIFEKFDPDTLFFIFYYQQGTYQQYLAARELKRQGWRFHKKYLTWFQRHEDPKVSTSDYETGTFVYFDYANAEFRGQGTGWCQRIKSEFVFEYRFLEDELI